MSNYVKLDDICKISSSKRIFEEEYRASGVPFIRGMEISNKSLLNDDTKFECYISKERYEEIKQHHHVPQVGDILITAVGTIENLAYISKNKEFYFKDGNVILFSDFAKNVYSKYLYYFMQSSFFKKQLDCLMIGAVQKALTMVMLKKVELPLPSYDKQKSIAGILSAIDEKIEINNKINAELENMAKTLYDYWFVQFDFPDENKRPYKSANGKMVYNEVLKREIPLGWEVKKLKDLVDINKVKTKPSKGKKLIDLSVMPSGTFCLDRFNEGNAFETNMFEMKQYDILFGSIRPYLMKAGFAPCNGLVSGTIHSLSPKNHNNTNYLILTMTSKNFFNYAITSSKGTKMPVIGTEDLLNYKLPYSKEIAANFERIIQFKEIISKKIIENVELATLRDFLLPLLMNGQVSVQN